MFLESTTFSKCLLKKIVIKYIFNSSPSNIISVSTLVVFDSLLLPTLHLIMVLLRLEPLILFNGGEIVRLEAKIVSLSVSLAITWPLKCMIISPTEWVSVENLKILVFGVRFPNVTFHSIKSAKELLIRQVKISVSLIQLGCVVPNSTETL